MSEARAFSIKRLDESDIRLVRPWLAMFGKAFDAAEEYTGAPAGEAYLKELLGQDGLTALAAIKDGAVIGGLIAYEFKKFEQERSEFYIYDLAVDEAHRRRGVATALIEALKPIARERGAHVIFVQADKGDAAPIELYSKLGVREDVLHFDIKVK